MSLFLGLQEDCVEFAMLCFSYPDAIIFHGLKSYKIIVQSTLISSLLTLAVSIALIYYANKIGLILSVFVPSVILLLTYCFHIKKSWHFGRVLFYKPFRLFVFKPVLSFTSMSAVAAIVFPSVLITIRTLLVEHSGVELASYWEGYSRLSLFMSGLAISSISLYYLPKLVKTIQDRNVQSCSLGCQILICPSAPAMILIFLFGSDIILLLYHEFFGGDISVKMGVVGDVFKTAFFYRFIYYGR